MNVHFGQGYKTDSKAMRNTGGKYPVTLPGIVTSAISSGFNSKSIALAFLLRGLTFSDSEESFNTLLIIPVSIVEFYS